jgi:DNA processing protein
MTIDDLKKTIEKIGLAVDEASGQVLVDWEKIPWKSSDRPYWAALSSILGVGPQLLATLVAYFGSAKQVFNQTNGALQSIKLPEKLIYSILHLAKAQQIPEWFSSQKLSFLAAPEEDFPRELRKQPSSPSHLWVWGNIKILNSRLPLAIVGTRKITPYGKDITYELSSKLSGRGVTVVSGLMYGVDEVAMRAALESGRRVVGVWAGGLTRASLGSRYRLAQEVVAGGGAVISELPPGQMPSKGLFPARNRIVAGMSKGVLITEGAVKSGSLITAGFGMEQGKPIFAVPGPVTSSLSAGPNELLKLGAHAVTRAEDIFAVLGINDKSQVTDNRENQFEYQPKNSIERQILDSLKSGPLSVDEIVRKTNLSISQVGETLIELDLAAAVRQMGDQWKKS